MRFGKTSGRDSGDIGSVRELPRLAAIGTRVEGVAPRGHDELRCEVGYWKSRHADAVKRIEQLKVETRPISRTSPCPAKQALWSEVGEVFSKRPFQRSIRSRRCHGPSEKTRRSARSKAGHGRRDYSHLPVAEEFISQPDESLICPICGKPAAMMSDTEDSELLEIDVRAHRRRIRRRRYRATCDCDPTRRTLTAPPPAKLIPKGNYGVSIWVLVLLDKYSSYRPTERLLGQLEQYDLDLPAGTINDGLRRIEPMLSPIYEAFCLRNRQGDFHQADETRWPVFVLLDGKKGYGWWLWVILGSEAVVYLLDPVAATRCRSRILVPRLRACWKWIGTRAIRPWRR